MYLTIREYEKEKLSDCKFRFLIPESGIGQKITGEIIIKLMKRIKIRKRRTILIRGHFQDRKNQLQRQM